LQNLLVDRWYLLKDMELLKNEIKFQKYRNNIFIISLILLFSFLLILVAFVL
jgi:pterin-4a-carbinolamine dehydratase